MNKRIGLLGGSFNPAHIGHVALSVEAKERLELDEIWWLFTPGNPLKDTCDLPDMDARMTQAEPLVAKHSFIQLSRIEAEFGTSYTIDTLKALQRRFPEPHFIWLMGADNLAQFHQWQDWQDIPEIMPFAVFAREPYSEAALGSKAAKALADKRVSCEQVARGETGWCFIAMKPVSISSTELRGGLVR